MTTRYVCYLDNKRNIVYKIMKNEYQNTYVIKYQKDIFVKDWIPTFLHKPIIFFKMIPKFKFHLFAQDGWPIRNYAVNKAERLRDSGHKPGFNVIETYSDNLGHVNIVEITEKQYLHDNYHRVFLSPFSSHNLITHFMSYMKCFPKPSFTQE